VHVDGSEVGFREALVKEFEIIAIVGGLFCTVAVGPIMSPADMVLDEEAMGSRTAVFAYAFFWALSFGMLFASVLGCTIMLLTIQSVKGVDKMRAYMRHLGPFLGIPLMMFVAGLGLGLAGGFVFVYAIYPRGIFWTGMGVSGVTGALVTYVLFVSMKRLLAENEAIDKKKLISGGPGWKSQRTQALHHGSADHDGGDAGDDGAPAKSGRDLSASAYGGQDRSPLIAFRSNEVVPLGSRPEM
jgi:hypothetical protein